MPGECRRQQAPHRPLMHQHQGRDSHAPSPCSRHGWSPCGLPQDGGNGAGTRAARPQPAAEVSAQEQGQLQWQRLTLCLDPRQGTAGKDRQSPPSQRALVPPASSLGPVPGAPRGRDRQDGQPRAGSAACPVASWQGGYRACCCRARGWVGWGHLLSRQDPQEGPGQGLGAAAQRLQPWSPSPLSRWKVPEPPRLGAGGSGGSAVCSQHSQEPTSSACLPATHPARCGAWGHGVPAAAGSRVMHRCCRPFSSQHNKSALAPSRRSAAQLCSMGPARAVAQPSWGGTGALKPEYGFNLEGSQCGGTLWALRAGGCAGAVFRRGRAAQSCALQSTRVLTHLPPPLPQPLLTWPTASTRRNTRARPSRGTRSLLWRRLSSRQSTWQVPREHGWPIPSA